MPPKPKKLQKKTSAPSSSAFATKAPWIALCLILLVVSIVRIRLAPLVLERDEGEYAYTGQLMLQGIPPYKLAYNMKLPGTPAAYALIMAVFGQTPTGIHLGLWLVNAASIIFVFLLARRFFSGGMAVAAAAMFAWFSLVPALDGPAAHATHFVVFFALAGILLLLHGLETDKKLKFFLSGLLLGFAFLMKQPGLAFSFFAMFWIFWHERKATAINADGTRGAVNWRRCLQREAWLWLGVLLPFVVTILILYAAGVFEKYQFWVWSYGMAYGTLETVKTAMARLREFFIDEGGPNRPLWIFPASGLLLLFFHKASRKNVVFIGALFLFSFAATSAGLYYRAHYFILLLPAVALLVCVAIEGARELLLRFAPTRWLRWLPLALFLGLGAYTFSKHVTVFFNADVRLLPTAFYSNNPFKEAVTVGNYIREHSGENDRVAVLGSEPEIYFYAQRRSATGYIYTYSLMEPQPFALQMQDEMIREIESVSPRYFVVVTAPFSWNKKDASHTKIMDWFGRYTREFYNLRERIPLEEAQMAPDSDPVKSTSFVYFYERKTS